jgi:gliding motility-associated-like protein
MKTHIFTKILSCLFVIFFSFTSFAKDWYVNNDNKSAATGSFSAGMDGTEIWCTAKGSNANPGTKAAPFLSLTYALTQAGNNDRIFVDAGTYGKGGAAGTPYEEDLTISQTGLQIIGAGNSLTVFDDAKNGTTGHSFLKIRANNVVIQDFFIRQYTQEISYAQAIDITTATYTGIQINRIKVDNNGATSGSYPIEISNASQVSITGGGGTCNSQWIESGGIRISGNATVSFNNYLFVGNNRGESGGALRVESGTVTIKNSLFSKNQGDNNVGVGMYQAGGTVTIDDCIIKENTTTEVDNDMGAVFLISGGTLTLNRSVFKDNTVSSSHYGALGVTGGTVNIDSVKFSGNTAGRGKDIYNNGGTINITNCTFSASSNVIGSKTGTITISNSGNPSVNAGYNTGVTKSNTTVSTYDPNPTVPAFTGDCTQPVKICSPAIAGAAPTAGCDGAATLTASITPSGGIFYWYDNLTDANNHIANIKSTPVKWKDTTSASTPNYDLTGVNATKTYYVISSSDACVGVVPITVTYNCPACTTTISYPTASICKGASNPTVTKNDASVGTYSSTAGLVFVSNTTGEIDLSASTPGTYTVTFTITAFCKPTTTITITAKPSTPTVGVVTQPTCTTSGSVTVSNFDNTQTYGFNPSAGISINTTTGVITATSGTYKFAATKGGCTSDSVSLTFNAVPGKPTITGATTICANGTVQLTGSGTPVSWASSSNAIATVSAGGLVSGVSAGTVTITYTDNSNCTQTASIQVDPVAVGGTATATSASLCTNTSTSISLTGNIGTVQWQSSPDGSTNWTNINNATSTTYSTGSLTTGTYYYRALITSGVCVTTATSNVVTITVSATPVAGTALATPDSICAGNTSILTLTGSTGTIQWQESANGSSGWVNITGATGATTANCTTASLNTTMFYKAVLSSGACTNVESAVLKVVVDPNVVASVTIDSDQTETAGEITICPDFTVVFTATPSAGLGTVTYQWKNKGVDINLATKSTYSTAGLKDGDIITCEIKTSGGKCITGSPATSNSIKVNVLVKDLSLIGNSPSSCNVSDGSINVKGTGTGTVKWALTATPTVFLGTHNGVTLTKNAPYETISNLGKGNYTITFNNGTCDFTKDVTLTDPSAPQDALLSVSSTLPICQGQTVTITANVADPLTLTGSTKYHWKKDGVDYIGAPQPQLGNSITVSASGTYSVILEDGACTSNSNDTVIDVTAKPLDPTIANATLTYCKSDNKKVSDLSALITNATKTITWYDLAIAGTASNSTDLLTTRSYYAEQSEGTCKSTNRLKVDVTVVNVTTPTLPGLIIQPSCSVATGTVDVNMPSSGIWDVTATPLVGAPTTVTTSNLTINPYTYSFAGLAPGTYTFKVKDVNGCASPVSTSAVINTQPSSPATPVLDGTKTYCASKSYTLDQILFSPSGSVKYYDANDVAISPKTVVVANTTYKFTFDNGTCESATKLATKITMDNGPAIAPVDISSTATICAVDNPTFNSIIAKLPVPVPAGYSLLVSPSPTGSPVIPNTTVIGSLGGATQTIYYNIVNDKGCQNANFAPLKFKINEGPTDLVLKNGIQPFCADKNPTVADLDATKVSGTGSLKWYATQGSTTPLPTNTPISNGTYYASIVANPGCESITKKSVIVEIETFTQTTLDAANSYNFCKGDVKTIADLPTKPYNAINLVWLDASKNVQNKATALIPGTYFAAETKGGCVSDKPQEIEVTFTSPVISISPLTLPVCAVGNGELTILGADPTYTYTWIADGVVLKETTSKLSNLKDDKSIKYSVIVTDARGCKSKDTTSFTDCEPAKIPQIITPNNDGKNDKFVLHYDSKYPKCKLFIYNRWGAMVYESDIPYKDDWDGKSNASDALGKDILPASTYFYMIDKGDGSTPESGYIELVK